MAGAEEWREVGIWVTSSQGAPCRRPPLPSAPPLHARSLTHAHTHPSARARIAAAERRGNKEGFPTLEDVDAGPAGHFCGRNVRPILKIYVTGDPSSPSIFTRFNIFHPPSFPYFEART